MVYLNVQLLNNETRQHNMLTGFVINEVLENFLVICSLIEKTFDIGDFSLRGIYIHCFSIFTANGNYFSIKGRNVILIDNIAVMGMQKTVGIGDFTEPIFYTDCSRVFCSGRGQDDTVPFFGINTSNVVIL